jgi:hypothetical protein
MLGKHIDAIALVVIALALLAFANRPQPLILGEVHAEGIRVQNIAGHTDAACPLTRIFARRFR